jgi:hypothetical protein
VARGRSWRAHGRVRRPAAASSQGATAGPGDPAPAAARPCKGAKPTRPPARLGAVRSLSAAPGLAARQMSCPRRAGHPHGSAHRCRLSPVATLPAWQGAQERRKEREAVRRGAAPHRAHGNDRAVCVRVLEAQHLERQPLPSEGLLCGLPSKQMSSSYCARAWCVHMQQGRTRARPQ